MVGLLTCLALPGACKKEKQPSTRPESARLPSWVNRFNVTLPVGNSQTEPTDAPLVAVGPNALVVAGDKVADIRRSSVDSEFKRDGPDGYFIDPLYLALKKVGSRLAIQKRKNGRPFRGHLRLAVDRRTTYRLLTEVIYTASQAEFKVHQILVRRASGRMGAVVIEPPKLKHSARIGGPKPQRQPLNLTLVMTEKGYFVKSRHGSECRKGPQRLCIATEKGRFTPAVLGRLGRHLWYLFAKKYPDSSHYKSALERHQLVVVPEPTISVGDLVATMDAAREIPPGAEDPRPKHPVPRCGCRREHDSRTGRWGFPVRGGVSVEKSACMFHWVVLGLGSF